MRYLKYMALLTVLTVPLAYSQAQVRVGVGIGFGPVGVAVGPAYVAGPPVCAYGYYPYYPYACAPYGYYAPDYFVDGVFVGAGPWYHWGHPGWFWNRAYVGRGWDHDDWHEGWGRGHVRGYEYEHEGHGYARGYAGNGYHGGGEFHGNGAFRGEGFHGGGGYHGGRR